VRDDAPGIGDRIGREWCGVAFGDLGHQPFGGAANLLRKRLVRLDPAKLVQRVAQEAGAKAAILAATVGSVKGTDTYLEAVDFNVKTLAQMLK